MNGTPWEARYAQLADRVERLAQRVGELENVVVPELRRELATTRREMMSRTDPRLYSGDDR